MAIISFILMTLMCESMVILFEEIRCMSLSGIRWLNAVSESRQHPAHLLNSQVSKHVVKGFRDMV